MLRAVPSRPDDARPFRPAGDPSGAGALPTYASTFVGRGEELHAAVRRLAEARLVTLTGPGGIGKTRMAVEMARRSGAGTPVFVDVAPLPDADVVAERVAAAFGLAELRGRELAPLVREALLAPTVLVLDNCEHLLAACTSLTRHLLLGCAPLRVLATSQHRLGIPGEWVWRLPPLGLPAAEAPEPAEALGAPAVGLFCERAAGGAGYTPSAADVPAIVEICRRLEGNPLAIELAAARVPALAPAQIAARLEQRFELLTAAPGATEGRHRSLAAALAWSHDLLSPAEQVVLRRLAVFAGHFDLEAAEAVAAGGAVALRRVAGLLAGLVSRSLLDADVSSGTARYRLGETIRLWAAEALAASGEAEEVAGSHACWCLAMVEAAVAANGRQAAVAALCAQADDVQAALRWWLARGEAEPALRLAVVHMVAWEASGRMAEARRWLGRALAAAGSAPAGLRAAGHHHAGFAALVLGDLDAAGREVAASMALAEQAGEPPEVLERTRGLASVVATFAAGPDRVEALEADLDKARRRGDEGMCERLVGCAHARLFRGEPAAARRHFKELAALARRRSDHAMVAVGLVGAGTAALGQGDCGAAAALLGEGVALAADSGETYTETVGRIWLAELARLAGDPVLPGTLEGCVGRARQTGSPHPLALALVVLGRAALDGADQTVAARYFEEAAAVARAGTLSHLEAAALDGLGQAALAAGDPAEARRRFEEAVATADCGGDRCGAALSRQHLGELARSGGDLTGAAALLTDALARFQAAGATAGVAGCLEALGGMAADRDDLAAAARLLGAAEALRQAGGTRRRPGPDHGNEAYVASLRRRMGPDALARTRAQGRRMTGDEAVAYATRGRGPRAGGAGRRDGLTRTEGVVAGLAAEGLTNAEIAERLSVTVRTVEFHMRNVLSKLGLTSRRQLIRWARRGEGATVREGRDAGRSEAH